MDRGYKQLILLKSVIFDSNYSVEHPPLPEQKRIVAILEKAFTAIDQAKANTEKNLKNARELFQSKLQETFANGKLKIDTGEWEEKKLEDSCNLITCGVAPLNQKRMLIKVIGVPFLSAQNVKNLPASYVILNNWKNKYRKTFIRNWGIKQRKTNRVKEIFYGSRKYRC